MLDFLVEVKVVLVEQFAGARLGLAPGAPQLVPLAQRSVEVVGDTVLEHGPLEHHQLRPFSG